MKPFTAIVENGVLKPEAPLDLPPGARVRIVLELLGDDARPTETRIAEASTAARLKKDADSSRRSNVPRRSPALFGAAVGGGVALVVAAAALLVEMGPRGSPPAHAHETLLSFAIIGALFGACLFSIVPRR